MSGSEIARLKQQIEAEVTSAKLALHGYAEVARHEIITHHFGLLGAHLQELTAYVGQQDAVATIIEILEKQL